MQNKAIFKTKNCRPFYPAKRQNSLAGVRILNCGALHLLHALYCLFASRRFVGIFNLPRYRGDAFDNAQLLYEWTRSQGLVLRYDPRLPPPKKPQRQSYPEYKVLSEDRSVDEHITAEVLIPSLSARTKPEEIERICRIICYEECIDECSFYSTMEAYEASNSDSYRRGSVGKLDLASSGLFPA